MDPMDSQVLYQGPYAGNSERALLAAALASSEALVEATALNPEDFSQPLDDVFKVMKAAREAGVVPTRELLLDRVLKGNDPRPEDGPLLSVLQNLQPAPADDAQVRAWVAEVKEYRARREMMSLLKRSSGTLMDGDKTSEEVAGQLWRDLASMKIGTEGEIEHVKSAIESYPHGFQAVLDPTRGPQPNSTGYSGLDRMLGGGFRPGELIIIGARPGMGKTSLALNLAKHVLDQARTVVMFSMEMSFIALAQRLLCLYGNIPYNEFRRGPRTPADHERLKRAMYSLAYKDFYGDQTMVMDAAEMSMRVRRMAMRHNVDMVVVDYLQLMEFRGAKGDSRVQEISAISRTLKILAEELQVPVLALSQLSRGIEARRGAERKPRLADLRESGSIEQDADIVMFVHRDEVYDPSDRMGEADIVIGKQRHGPLGTVKLRWRPEMMRFEEPSSWQDDE